MGINLCQVLTSSAGLHPRRQAVAGASPTTFRQLDELTGRFAALLRGKGLQPGDRVLVRMPNSLAFVVAYFGALKAGAVVVPATTMLRQAELGHMVTDADVTFVVSPDEAAARFAGVAVVTLPADAEASDLLRLLASEPASKWVERAPEDIAVVVYTSGTTGCAKGAALTHSNMLWNAAVMSDALSYTPDDVALMALPGSHVMGQSIILNAALASGASVLPLARFEPETALQQMAEFGVTALVGVPTLLTALLDTYTPGKHARLNLRLAGAGGAPVPDALLRSFADVFGCTVFEGYGLSECSGAAVVTHTGRVRKPGSAGQPIWGVEVRIVNALGAPVPAGEEGEIEIRGHNVMAGYLNHNEATAQVMRPGGWMATGDIGRVDEDGDVFVLDRAKDVIIRGGFNVYPREVEEVLLGHPHIREAAVVGVPHRLHGEEIAAVVVTDGAQPDPDDLRAFVRERLAPYKYPRLVTYVDQLPKGPTGKLLRREAWTSTLKPDAGSPDTPV